jgi:hypothetical protein
LRTVGPLRVAVGLDGVAKMTWTVSDGRGGTASAELRVTVEDDEPANRAPVVKCSSQTWPLCGVSNRYRIWVSTSYFEDPDGDNFTIYARQPDWGSIGAYDKSCESGRFCSYYYPGAGWDGAPAGPSFTLYAEDSKGARSSSISVQLCVNC